MPDSQVQLVITAPEPYGAALAHRMKCRMTLGAQGVTRKVEKKEIR